MKYLYGRKKSKVSQITRVIPIKWLACLLLWKEFVSLLLSHLFFPIKLILTYWEKYLCIILQIYLT